MKFEFLTRANAGALHTLCTGDKPEFAAANAKREEWLDGMFRQGLRGWVAFQDGIPAGYVEYLPIQVAPFPVVARSWDTSSGPASSRRSRRRPSPPG